MEDTREKESNLILKKSFTSFTIGVVLVLLGIVNLSRFVHISYFTAVSIAGAAVFLVLVGIIVTFVGTRKPTPVPTNLGP